MGFIGKLKNIFYDVEEVEVADENTSNGNAKVEQIIPKKETSTTTIQSNNTNSSKSDNNYSERELIKQRKTFPFPIFDDEEETPKPKTRNNILDLEPTSASRTSTVNNQAKLNINRDEERRYEGSYSLKTQNRVKETPYNKVDSNSTTKKVFKPTPVISPVYGILDKNYTKEEIKENIEEKKKAAVKNNNVDYVRNKAFGNTKENDLEETLTKINDEVRESVNSLSKEIENLTENKTDDLTNLLNKIETKEDITIEEAEKMYDEGINKKEKEEELEDEKVDNTLEHDLFNLIDSMYDNKEE